MEELKMIAEVLKNLGGEAQTAFIIWVLVRYCLLYLFTTSIFFVLIVVIYKTVKRWIFLSANISEIMEAAGCQGVELSSYDVKKITMLIKKGKGE